MQILQKSVTMCAENYFIFTKNDPGSVNVCEVVDEGGCVSV